MSKSPLYYAKILLFGEYGIINDAQGLSIPYNFYQGAFRTEAGLSGKAEKSNLELRKYLNHLISLRQQGTLPAELNLEEFEKDLDEGLYFDSSIPEGYGVGSSGAICAAIYDHYAINRIDPENGLDKQDIPKLKKIFGEMES